MGTDHLSALLAIIHKDDGLFEEVNGRERAVASAIEKLAVERYLLQLIPDRLVNIAPDAYAMRDKSEPDQRVFLIRDENLRLYLDNGCEIYDGLVRCYLPHAVIRRIEDVTLNADKTLDGV